MMHKRKKRKAKKKAILISVPPQLVAQVSEEEDVTADGLFDAPKDGTRVGGTFIMHLPTDPVVMGQMYDGIRPPRKGEERSSVTFDLEAARERYESVIQPVVNQTNGESKNVT